MNTPDSSSSNPFERRNHEAAGGHSRAAANGRRCWEGSECFPASVASGAVRRGQGAAAVLSTGCTRGLERPRRTAWMRSNWSWPQRRGVSPTCFPSVTDAWRAPRSRSTAARPSRWQPTWRPLRPPVSASSAAGTHTCPTSAVSPRRSGGSSFPSTTSMRRSPHRGSGTSNVLPRASSWPAATMA